MVDYAHALSWMIISPVAVLTDILAIITIAHYYPFFHGTDVMLTSLLSAMTANAVLVLPIPAFLELKGMPWNPSLCIGYTWCFITFRLAQIMSLTGMSVHWSAMLKVSAEKRNYFSTKTLKICTVFIWVVSSIIGLLPLIGAVSEDFNTSKQCRFLAFNLGVGFAIFFLVFIVACMMVSLICAFDATLLLRQMKQIAKVKYQTGRFYVPDQKAGVPAQGSCSLSERCQRLKFAWDLSRFVLCLVLMAFLGNHFPYTIIQAVQLFGQVDRNMLETLTLWLIGLEALLLPHVLWFFSRRYRHALTYVWQVYLLRRKDVEEEDPWSCMLQSYTQKDRDRKGMTLSRPPFRLGQNGGHISASGTLRSMGSDIQAGINSAKTNGQTLIATISDGVEEPVGTIIRQNGVVQDVRVVSNVNTRVNERSIDVTIEDNTNRTLYSNMPSVHVRRVSGPERSVTPISTGADVQRSISSCSRKEWKDQVKKKHLPPIFVNEGFDSEEQKSLRERRELARQALFQNTGSSTSNSSLHYYMSSDYHPDYLTESITKHKPHSSSESDSNGPNEQYNDSDIGDVLDRTSRKSSGRLPNQRSTESDTMNVEPMPLIQRPYLNNFRIPTFTEKEDIIAPEPFMITGSMLMHPDIHELRDESEISFDSGSIPLQEIDDGYNSPKDVRSPNYNNQVVEMTSSVRVESPKARKPEQAKLKETLNSRAYYKDKNRGTLRRQVYDNPGVIEMSTSFSKQTSDSDLRENSLGSTGSFTVTDINSLTSDMDLNSQNTQIYKNSFDDKANESNGSSDSSSSVTVSPYKDEERRRPWMQHLDDDDYDDNMLMLHLQEPLVQESDTDTLKDSHDNTEYGLNFSIDSRASVSSSEIEEIGVDTTPVSSIFDDETDRGFEEALEAHVNPALFVYGGVGLCFESIKEEPEDLTSSSSNPFMDDLSSGNEQFKTHAVVSKRTDSRTSSSSSMSDRLGSNSNDDVFRPGVITPTIITTDADNDFGDSGFTSAIDQTNHVDISNQPDSSASGKFSPWPDSDQCIDDSDLSFESDFSETSNHDKTLKYKPPVKPKTFKKTAHFKSSHSFDEGTTGLSTSSKEYTGYYHAKPVKTTRSPLTFRKPVNASVGEMKSRERQMPVRAHSFEEKSNISNRTTAVARSGSLEGPKRDIKPAYF